jgi:hypothetical protein
MVPLSPATASKGSPCEEPEVNGPLGAVVAEIHHRLVVQHVVDHAPPVREADRDRV